MAEDYIDELDETLDDLEPVSGTPELYEHFRVVVDKGQSPVRIDKYLFERIVNASRNRIRTEQMPDSLWLTESLSKAATKSSRRTY